MNSTEIVDESMLAWFLQPHWSEHFTFVNYSPFDNPVIFSKADRRECDFYRQLWLTYDGNISHRLPNDYSRLRLVKAFCRPTVHDPMYYRGWPIPGDQCLFGTVQFGCDNSSASCRVIQPFECYVIER